MKKYYAVKAKNDDIRRRSSSGGVFYVLASDIIKNDGVVYGAIYNEALEVIHSRATTCEELKAMHGSKYSRSDFMQVMDMIGEDLNNNKIVLFTGTPCQVNTVKTKYKDNAKLITISVVCYGTPSKEYLADYIKFIEKKYKSKVKKINMRYKDAKEYAYNKKNLKKENSIITPHNFYIELENGKKIIERSDFNLYYQLFDLFMPQGCFKCPFASLDRVSDITIGDFHEFNTKLLDFNDSNGVSLVIVSSKSGDELFNKNIDAFDVIEQEESKIIQPALTSPAKEPKNYKLFVEEYKKYGFEYVSKKYCTKGLKFNIKKILYKIGLLNVIEKIKNKK